MNNYDVDFNIEGDSLLLNNFPSEESKENEFEKEDSVSKYRSAVSETVRLLWYQKLQTSRNKYKGEELDKPRIIKLAPTGIAAINIDGTTIHTGLSMGPSKLTFLWVTNSEVL